MAPEIPGFYFDAEKNKYFKIEKNHIAPRESKYSQQAVNAEKALDTVARQEEASKNSLLAATVLRTDLLKRPAFSFDHRLGSRQRHPRVAVGEYYAANLHRRDAFGPTSRSAQLGRTPFYEDEYKSARKFAIDERSGTLFTAATFGQSHPQAQHGARSPYRHVMFVAADRAVSQDILNRAHDLNNGSWPAHLKAADSEGFLYGERSTHAILPTTDVDCILAPGDDTVVWTHTVHALNRPSQSTLCFSYPPTTGAGRESDRTTFATIKLRTERTIHHLASSPRSGLLALAASDGVHTVPDFHHGTFHKTALTSDTATVAFLDDHVLMAGDRYGRISLLDTRAAAVRPAVRLRHSSAVSALQPLSDARGRLLAVGLGSMAVYDLRYTPAPAPVPRRPRKRGPHHPSSSSSSPSPSPVLEATASPPLVSFATPPHRAQQRLGLAFAYEPELNIAVTASTDFHRHHHVHVWDVDTGRALASPLSAFAFQEPPTCAQFVRVRDGMRSLVVNGGGMAGGQRWLGEWCVQGTGEELG